jgi:hypothetical protein
MKAKTSALVAAAILFLIANQFSYCQNSLILFDFHEDTNNWRSDIGTVTRVDSPSYDGNGSLRMSVSLLANDKFSANEYSSPWIDRNLSKYDLIQLHVLIKSNNSDGLQGQIFVKSGPNYIWDNSNWIRLRMNSWNKLAISCSEITNLSNIRAIGMKIGSNDGFEDSTYIDLVEAIKINTLHEYTGRIRINEITSTSIFGSVKCDSFHCFQECKVLIYAKYHNSNHWILYPYYEGGDGLSYAKITNNGSWNITRKSNTSSSLEFFAALLVDIEFVSTNIVEDLGTIDYADRHIYRLRF